LAWPAFGNLLQVALSFWLSFFQHEKNIRRFFEIFLHLSVNLTHSVINPAIGSVAGLMGSLHATVWIIAMLMFRSFLKDESGATALEYGFIVGLIGVVIVAAMVDVVAVVEDIFAYLGKTLSAAVP
jgi:pilus assembly protein Flp/PilA